MIYVCICVRSVRVCVRARVCVCAWGRVGVCVGVCVRAVVLPVRFVVFVGENACYVFSCLDIATGELGVACVLRCDDRPKFVSLVCLVAVFRCYRGAKCTWLRIFLFCC